MKIKAVFLDFYGTLVHEDDDILPLIYEQIQISAGRECTHREIGSYWWRAASSMYDESFGDAYRLQRDIGIQSLADTLQFYGSSLASEELISTQFDHWAKPVLYEDTLPFIAWLRSEGIRSYILSNIDTADVLSAVDFYGIEVDGIITSESVRSYKPRPEMFQQALTLSGLQPDEVVHVGDSLKSDILGAQSAGLAAIWLNRLGRQGNEQIVPSYACENLEELRFFLADKEFA